MTYPSPDAKDTQERATLYPRLLCDGTRMLNFPRCGWMTVETPRRGVSTTGVAHACNDGGRVVRRRWRGPATAVARPCDDGGAALRRRWRGPATTVARPYDDGDMSPPRQQHHCIGWDVPTRNSVE